jgi:hypothetical protein
MTSQEEIERLVGYALLADGEYRQWFLTDPKAAAATIGIELADDEAAYIQQTVTLRRLNAMAKSFAQWMPPPSRGNWQAKPIAPDPKKQK